ncbi:MAG: efflux RND transporter periplasmic adaptor subunit [Acidobacteria bacterium]|nr:MAG: efflux RND transporter periplasmic adaptor subunit [Acidobacteriota bacterium]
MRTAGIRRVVLRRWPLLLAAAVLAVAAFSRQTGVPGSRRGTIVELVPEPVTRRVHASGELRPARPVTIGPPVIRHIWNYTITSLVEEGSVVEAGAPVVTFDTRELQETLDVKRSELETARRELDKIRLEEQDKLDKLLVEHAELEAQRARLARKLAVPPELVERNELAKTRIDAALVNKEIELNERQTELQRESMATRIELYEKHVARLARRVAEIERNIEAMTVRAPRGGFVSFPKERGLEKPKVGETVWSGRPLLEIADLSNMEVAAEIDEPDASLVRPGQRVEIRLDAAPDRRFSGKVLRLGRLFRIKSSDMPKKVLDAVVSIDDPDPELMRPGMAAQLEILCEAPRHGLLVPEEAVVQGPQGPAVLVLDGNRERWVTVELGERVAGRVVVRGGLRPGDRVVVAGGQRS